MSIDLTKSEVELDQEDIFARLACCFPQVAILLQRRGVIESDVETALAEFNPANGKSGAVIIVLMPKLLPEMKDAPGPRYFARYGVQVICWPPAALGSSGAGLTAEAITETLIDVDHYLSLGRGGTLVFDGAEPVTVKTGRVSYICYFRRLGVLNKLPKVTQPVITYDVQISPPGLNITLASPTAGADLWYTLDGTYPAPTTQLSSSTALRYTGPFFVPVPSSNVTLRVLGDNLAAGFQPSNITNADITPADTIATS
jgi:hypothetical protein